MRYLIILLTAWMVNSACAAAHPINSESEALYEQCTDKAEADYDFYECHVAYLDNLDKLLNEVWHELYHQRAPVSTRAQKALLNEQRKWIAFKDSSCLFWTFGFGTIGRHINFPSCREKIIEHRNKVLIALIPLDHLMEDTPLNSFDIHDEEKKLTEASEHFKKNDAELNRVWREIRRKWSDEYYQPAWRALLDEQRKWVTLKENSCQYYAKKSDITRCLSKITENRIDKLKEILNFEN